MSALRQDFKKQSPDVFHLLHEHQLLDSIIATRVDGVTIAHVDDIIMIRFADVIIFRAIAITICHQCRSHQYTEQQSRFLEISHLHKSEFLPVYKQHYLNQNADMQDSKQYKSSAPVSNAAGELLELTNPNVHPAPGVDELMFRRCFITVCDQLIDGLTYLLK